MADIVEARAMSPVRDGSEATVSPRDLRKKCAPLEFRLVISATYRVRFT